MTLAPCPQVPKTQDELLVQRIQLVFAKHPLAGWGLELCLCGGNMVVFCTCRGHEGCKFSCDYDWKYFTGLYLRQYDPDDDQHDTGCGEEPIWYEDSTTLAVIFAQPQLWVTQLRLELSKRPPLGNWHGRGFESHKGLPDEVCTAAHCDIALLDHQVPLQECGVAKS